MAIVHHVSRGGDGNFITKTHEMPPMDFIVKNIPDGTPFVVYRGAICAENEVTEDYDALQTSEVFFVIESPGGGLIKKSFGVITKILSPILRLIIPSAKAPSIAAVVNQQGTSPNNSLTDRSNKPRPYERTYDICGTVQSIPNNLMTTYKKYNSSGDIIEYGFYDVGRGPLNTPAEGITDGDTRLMDVGGSSAAVYGPFTSPNSGTPQTQIGPAITEGLYVTVVSNEVDGAELKASNDLAANIGSVATVIRAGSVATITDATGDSGFNDYMSVGDSVELNDIIIFSNVHLSGIYTITSVSNVDISFIVPVIDASWALVTATPVSINAGSSATTGPADKILASWTDWFTVRTVQTERVVANFGALNGMYKDNGSKIRTSVTVELEYQAVENTGTAYGPVYSTQGKVSGRTTDATGVSLIGVLPTASAFRARARRVTLKDTAFSGQVVDSVTFDNLYGQTQDFTPNYGNRTTIHTARQQTPRATSIKSPKLALIVTERLYRYVGDGVFDTVLTDNNEAVQSLIRLLRDPVCGGLSLTANNMDRLLSVQSEITSYFGSPEAGQFCYTFDSYETTMQDIINAVADAVFCRPYREGNAVLLDLDRPRIGPELVFTHRSKAPGEKWTRNFNTKDKYDSLKFSYIDPNTNIKETIVIPENGGLKTETYDSKGIRNYKQAYWSAYRRYQKNTLNRVAVEFSATEEGVFARPGRAISVVKGSRVSPFDGYVVAVDGLTLVLSQNVEFVDGDDHSLILKQRDGSVQSVGVIKGHNDRTVIMTSAPQEAIYVGNSALKTEFSFGNEERHKAQMIVVSTVEPGNDRTVKITGYNYTDEYYAFDGVDPFGRAFSNGFDGGFS